MRTAITLLTVALSITATAACKKKDKDAPAGGSASGATTQTGSGSATAPAGSGDATGSGSAGSAVAGGSGSDATGSGAGSGSAVPGEPEMTKRAGNCPSTVFGAITKAAVKGKDVVLTITSEDKDAVLAIQKRADALVKEKQDGGAGAGHDQKGTHGGGMGICPVYVGEGGKVSSKKIAKGAEIAITPGTEKPEELKATIDGRIAKAADWVEKNIKPADQGNTGGVGGGKGEHGSTHHGAGDSKGKERKDGTGGGAGTGGGGGKGTGGGKSDAKPTP